MKDLRMHGVAAVTDDYRKIGLWSLVLYASNVQHLIERNEDGWVIRVSTENQERASDEITAYEKENLNWPPPKEEVDSLSFQDRQPPTVALMGVMMIFYTVTGPWEFKSDWFRQGALSSVRVLEHGEWWRVLTALTLHADSVHLLGNVIIGGMVIHFLSKIVGAGFGWTLVLLSGVLGNTLNILLRSGDHHAVGFSTAVFGAIGILCGLQAAKVVSLKGLLLPLGAGAGLLGFLGTEGQRTDLGAHLWGLVAGFSLGLAFLKLMNGMKLAEHPRAYYLLYFCFIVVYGCWRVAMIE
ncbi:MAG: rhomboid family intramembrane serine protease [Desulfobulbaceae bacterium]|nr:rhomboid family intramembrane serine protease [Desulfobulbaceae bacterium]